MIINENQTLCSNALLAKDNDHGHLEQRTIFRYSIKCVTYANSTEQDLMISTVRPYYIVHNPLVVRKNDKILNLTKPLLITSSDCEETAPSISSTTKSISVKNNPTFADFVMGL